MNYRNRRLLDLAHSVCECQNCERYTNGCEPAHENSVEAGKGFGIKSRDNRHAALCHECHAWYDQSIGDNKVDPSGLYMPTKRDKESMWNRAHKKTFDHYWVQGSLGVK